MRTPSIVKAFAFATIAGCTGTGSGTVMYSGEVTTPNLIEIEPGVQVIADYDEPVFYSDDVYWRYDAGIWYRSSDYRRGWARVEAPPERVRRIERPTAYVHYRAGARIGVEDRDHRSYQPQPQPQPSPVVRDHRDYQPQPQPRPMPQPVERDHRVEAQPQPQPSTSVHVDAKVERRDVREQNREERKDDHRENKAERREQKEERHEDKKENDHRHH